MVMGPAILKPTLINRRNSVMLFWLHQLLNRRNFLLLSQFKFRSLNVCIQCVCVLFIILILKKNNISVLWNKFWLSLLSYFEKNCSYVSGLSVCIFVALFFRLCCRGPSKVEGTMSWCLGTNEILASKRDFAKGQTRALWDRHLVSSQFFRLLLPRLEA